MKDTDAVHTAGDFTAEAPVTVNIVTDLALDAENVVAEEAVAAESVTAGVTACVAANDVA